jgi:uncharacterized protein (DUF4415 family)
MFLICSRQSAGVKTGGADPRRGVFPERARRPPAEEGMIGIRRDRDVLDFFLAGKRYETRINAVLRAYVEHERRKAKPP